MELDSDPGYLPIAAYGVIGNLRTVALVGCHGSIDWCCLPDLDAPSAFGALLDRGRGGRFRISPRGACGSTQEYISETNVLVTRFDTGTGVLEVTDFMPVPTGLHADRAALGLAEIHRLVRCLGGEVDMRLEWAPRFDYAQEQPVITPGEHGFVAEGTNIRLDLGVSLDGAAVAALDDGPAVVLERRMVRGDRFAAVTRYGGDAPGVSYARSAELRDETIREWRRWVQSPERGSEYEFAGPWRDMAVRSSLALKLLTYPSTGAIAAAATTSLPEHIGGVRNWDYRYMWIRDAAFAAQAFFALGHREEAIDFIEFTERVAEYSADNTIGLQIMYTIRGDRELPEGELPHLEGYRGSRPVRVGNAAAAQLQIDIYGQLLNAADELVHLDGGVDADRWRFLRAVTDEAVRVWREPDSGIWEVRSKPEHFTYSKVMCWVALDRAIWLADTFALEADLPRWRAEREALHAMICAQAFDPTLGAFARSFGSNELDAANLLIPLLEFLPFEDPRVQGTIDRTIAGLTENGLVYRYHADDGLPGGEGAFGLSTFWLVDALAMSGRLDEAYEYFERMLGHASPLGLYAEQIDPASGELLGNFPQAFTHLGLINSLVYLGHAEGRPLPFAAPLGSPARRMKETPR